MDVLIDNSTNGVFNEEFERIVRDVLREALELEKIHSNPQISVSIVDAEQMRELNKKFRQVDSSTDVLSFPMIDFDLSGKDILNHENILLGDIVICMDKVFSQALEYGHSCQREIGFLTAHGILHLLGYDHINPDDEKIMFSKQEMILEKVGLTR